MPTLFGFVFAITGFGLLFYIAGKSRPEQIGETRIYRIPALIAFMFSLVPLPFIYALIFQILPHTDEKAMSIVGMGSLIFVCMVGAGLMWRCWAILGVDSMRYILDRNTIVEYASVRKLALRGSWIKNSLIVIYYGEGRKLEISRFMGDFDDMVETLRQRCPGATFETR